ncbi:MAG: hypothetical protein JNL09_01255 [Anaerolineales bacterium]|nr:hypothetical protein [Anaerolineales bacterium]
MSTTDPRLVEAYKFIRASQFKAARQNLREALKNNPHSQRAWLLMSMAVTDATQQAECLRRVLSLNPDNTEAQHRLALLQPAEAAEPELLAVETAATPITALPADIEIQPTVAQDELAPTEVAPEPEAAEVATPIASGVVETEVALEAEAEPAAEVVEAVAAASPAELAPEAKEPEPWFAEPQGLPEWLVAQSLIDETLPDVEPLTEEEFEDEEPATENLSIESTPTAEPEAPHALETASAASPDEPLVEATPTPRAKRRRARRLHTDYLLAHQAQVDEELPEWLKEEAEKATHPPVALPAPVPVAPAVITPEVVKPVAPTPVVPPPTPNLEPAPIRLQPPRPPATPVVEKGPLRPYYHSNYPQGDAPSWALPILLILLTLVVIGIVALLIYMVL